MSQSAKALITKPYYRRTLRPALAAFLSLLVLCAIPVSADTGNISFSVTLANKLKRIANVELRLTSRDGNEITVQTDKNGNATLNNIETGLYTLEARKPGYLPVIEPSVRIVGNKTTPLALQLQTSAVITEETLVIARAIDVTTNESVSASRFDRETLRSAPGSGSDVLRALDGMPGLVSTGDFASFTVRGRGPKDNLILVDDIPFADVVHFNGALGDEEDLEGGGRYSIFAPNLIDNASYQAGGWEAEYGGRSGSLLNLEVARGNPKSPALSTRIDLAGFELTYDGPSYLHDNTSVLFSARRLDFGKFFELIDLQDIGSPALTDIILKTHTELENNTFNFLAIYAPEEHTRDIENAAAGDDGVIEETALEDVDQDNELYAFTWKAALSDNIELTQKMYSRKLNRSSSEGESWPDIVPEGTPTSDIPIREKIITLTEGNQEVGLRTDLVIDNSLGEFRTGLRFTDTRLKYQTHLEDDWIRYVYDQNDYREDPNQRYIVLTPESVNANLDLSAHSYTGYVEQFFVFDTWEMRSGLRYDHDGFADENLTSPRFGARFNTHSPLSFSATAGIFYQAPEYLDRARDESNSNLKNEKVTQFSLGLEYRINSDWKFISEIYHQDLDNLVTEGNRTDGIMDNTTTGSSYGADFVLSKRFTNNWSGSVNYSYNKSTVNNHDDKGDLDADFHRPHAFSIASVWEINEHWKLSARWKFMSGRPKDSFIIHENVLGDGEAYRYSREITGEKTERFDDYHSLNFRADYRRDIGVADMIAFIDILNVYGSPDPDEIGFSIVTGDNVEKEGEILPLLGLRFEF